MGRNKFFDFLRQNNLLVPKLKNYHITTNSKHQFYKYKNLIKYKTPTRPEQLWVSDITYIKTQHGHNYLALVTDAYSKQIMGFKIDNNMKASICVEALDMAIKNRKYPNRKLIHHSDRGFQYCSSEYVDYATSHGMLMSMTEEYDPYENAIAERVNRTLKYEYGLKQTIKNLDLAKKIIKDAIYRYNNWRLHDSLELRTPIDVHRQPDIPYKSYVLS
jgi:transposase InsO family protein